MSASAENRAPEPATVYEFLRQLPARRIPPILRELRTLEKKTFVATEAFPFDNNVLKQRNMEVLLGFGRHATNSSLLAYAVCVTSNRRLLLHKICVAPGSRARGIGSELMRTVLEFAKNRSCRGVDLWVNDSNHPARNLYAKHGFITQAMVHDYYGPGRNGVKMSLDLHI
jgi:ribosomal protein S18 acetylase RimI-like enzyme